ncbi:MAG TPA: serine/threonine-protein kinase [Chitinispirillaceae bacterium]|nr:serine/threonine-protein kinase [Chitinispirillaceae bacterium]
MQLRYNGHRYFYTAFELVNNRQSFFMLDTNTSVISINPENYIGRDIKGITLIELLGRGATGLVYTAYQKSLKRKVALKLFPKQTLKSVSVEKFRTEAETVAVLNHPNIAPVFDMGETEEFLFIVMQLIGGQDMRLIIQRLRKHPVLSRRTLSKKTAVQIMLSVLDALEYAHSQQVIHQDVKPANIIIEEQNYRPYLVDFGIARTILSEQGLSQFILGTPLYMAPEQASGQQTDSRADIYSAGIVLYEAVSGVLPVQKVKTEEILRLKICDPDSIFTCKPSQHNGVIDRELERIICKATSAQPSMRYQECASFKEDLAIYAKTLQEQ